MSRNIWWVLGMGVVGLILAAKETYWFPNTYFHDIESLTLGFLAGTVTGFLFSCIIEKTIDRRRARAKVLYWLLVMAIFGCYLGFGKDVPARTTLMVMTSTLGVGLAVGLLQYFLQSKESMR